MNPMQALNARPAFEVYRIEDPISGDCSVCHESLNNGEDRAVIHFGGGELHPFHENCLQKSVQVMNGKCPFCRQAINFNSIFSWSERAIRTAKSFTANTIVGGAVTAAGGPIIVLLTKEAAKASGIANVLEKLAIAVTVTSAALAVASTIARKMGCDGDAIVVGLVCGGAVFGAAQIPSAVLETIAISSAAGGLVAGALAVVKPNTFGEDAS